MPKRRRSYGKSYGSKRRKVGSRKVYRRKSTRKRRLGRPSKTKVPGFGGIADSLSVKLRYSSIHIVTSTAGAIKDTQYRGNSIFDPEVGVGGDQPYWFDQYAAFYNYYRVAGSSIKVTAWNQDSNSSNIPLVGELTVVPSLMTSDFSAANHQQMTDQPYATQKQFQARTNTCKIKKYMSTNKIFGYGKYADKGDPQFRAAIGADPSAQWRWHVCFNTMDQANNLTVVLKIEVVYYVTFYERAVQASS